MSEELKIPAGWTVERKDGALIVWHPDIGGYAATEDAKNIAATILYSFVRDLLASPPPPEDGWKPMSSAPQTEHTPFLVYLPRTMAGSREVNEPCIVQVSRFEGNLYPDAMANLIDWSDRITTATAWRPVFPPPAALEPKEQQ